MLAVVALCLACAAADVLVSFKVRVAVVLAPRCAPPSCCAFSTWLWRQGAWRMYDAATKAPSDAWAQPTFNMAVDGSAWKQVSSVIGFGSYDENTGACCHAWSLLYQLEVFVCVYLCLFNLRLRALCPSAPSAALLPA